MVDPTSDVGEIDEEDAPTCEVCGTKIVNDPDHRVFTWIDDDDQVQHREFCSDACLEEWKAESSVA